MTICGLTVGPAPTDRTKKIQKWLVKNDFSAFIMLRTDEFQGEYLPPYAERLHWLTGFSGSAGIVIVGREKNAVFTDGRYIIQIKNELNSDIYQAQHLVNKPTTLWIKNNFKSGDIIAYDPWLFTPNQLAVYKKVCGEIGIKLEPTENPIDLIWQDQPSPPVGKVVVHPIEYTGVSHEEKISTIAKSLIENNLKSCVITMTCSISWLFNIRGSDVPFNPVILGYSIVYADGSAEIYTDKNKIDDVVLLHLGSTVTVRDFSEVATGFYKLDGNVGVDNGFIPEGLISIINSSDATSVQCEDMARKEKIYKSKDEQQCMRDCHIRDGAVMARMLHWVDTTPVNEQNEWVNARKLEEFRSKADKFKDYSFDTISGFGENGAICHYRVNEETALQFENNNLFLMDSGSQYEDGTTDITRTVIIGTPSQEHKHNFTLVLRGLIGLHMAKFPISYTAEQVDCIARAPLFVEGKNYDHSTGHGVGSALNVHEGPLYFSSRGRDITFDEGTVMSNEPGYYPAGQYGIRIENLMISHSYTNKNTNEKWIEWENITWCPIDTRLVDINGLSPADIVWLNSYHQSVWEKIYPLVKDEPEVYNWLMTACEPIF